MNEFNQKVLSGEKIYVLLLGLILVLPLSLQLRPIAIPLGSFYITLLEAIMILLIFLWPFQLIRKRNKNGGQTQFGIYVLLFMIMYFVYLVFGIASEGPIMALGDFRQYLPLYLFFPLLHYLDSDEKLQQLRKVVVGVIAIVAFYSVILFMFFNELIAATAAKQGLRILGERIYMVNSLAVLFAYLGYIIAKLFNSGTKVSQKIFYILIIVLNGIMLLFMQSRSLWAMFAAIVFLSVFSLKKLQHKILYVLMGGYVLVLFIVVPYLSVNVFNYRPTVIKRIQENIVDRAISFTELGKVGKKNSRETKSIGTLDTRFETAKRVIHDHIFPSFILGNGFGHQIPMVSPRGEIFKWKFQVDNAYLTVFAKFGLLGFLLYFLFTLKVIRSLLHIIFHPKVSDIDAVLAKSFLYMIFVIIMGSFTSSIFIRQQPLIIGFLIMLCETETMASKYRVRR